MDNPVTSQSILTRAFPGIGTAQAEEIIASGKIASYPTGTILCQEGALESVFYLILAGKVRVTKKIESQQERTLQKLEPGGFFWRDGYLARRSTDCYGDDHRTNNRA